jgi:xylulokinase
MININESGAAYGAALLAAVSAGIFENIEAACKKAVCLKESDKPQSEYREKYDIWYEYFRDLYKHLKPIFRKIGISANGIKSGTITGKKNLL